MNRQPAATPASLKFSLAPPQCDNDCNGNGVCECTTIECVCQCYESYTGTSCELGIENAKTTINMAGPWL